MNAKGAANSPSNLSIISKPPVSLTWLAPSSGCVFNYTINIINYSSSIARATVLATLSH